MKQTFTLITKLAVNLVFLMLSVGTAWSQTIQGIVTDSLNNPLPGANVVIKGTTIGTTTDAAGAYSLTDPGGLSSNTVLVFSLSDFNTQQEVYTKTLADLGTANTLFDPEQEMVFGTDILYNNNVGHWRRFCNSLHLRLVLRVSKREEMNAHAKLVAMINDPAQYPVFTSNGEAAILEITGVEPNLSPWGRAIDFTLFRAAGEFFVDNLNAWNDPRNPLFHTEARASDGTTVIGYKGIPSGFASDQQFDFLPSNVNIALVEAPMISVIMSYAEVEFSKAELAQKGILTGVDGQTHYEKGVVAAIEQWVAKCPPITLTSPRRPLTERLSGSCCKSTMPFILTIISNGSNIGEPDYLCCQKVPDCSIMA
jgi:hypothetical protein